MGLNGNDMKKFVISKIGTPYVYGAKFQHGPLTQQRVDTLARQYPKMFTQTYLNKIKNKQLVGKICVDCSGLISGYTGKILGSSQLYSTAYARMEFKDFEKFAVGTVLWKQGHVGVYCGKNSKGQPYCVEAKGIDYGTIASLVTPNDKWKYGLTFSDIEYEYDEALKIFYKKENPYTKPAGTIRPGSKGNGVRWLQYELIESGFGEPFVYNYKTYKGVTIDGSFGPITKAALKAFQASCKIEVDGVCGKESKQYLINED